MKAIEAKNEAMEAEIERQTAMIEKKKRIKELAAERLRAETGVCVCMRVCVSSAFDTLCIHTHIYVSVHYYFMLYIIERDTGTLHTHTDAAHTTHCTHRSLSGGGAGG